MVVLLMSFLTREKTFFYPLYEVERGKTTYVYTLDLEGALLSSEIYIKDQSIIIDGHDNSKPLPMKKLVVRSTIARSSIELVERPIKKVKAK